MEKNKEKIEVFSDLLHITNDRLKGYQSVKEKISTASPEIQQWFDGLQQQTYEMQNTLMDHLGSLGATDIDQDGTVLGSLHRAWIDVKNTFAMDKVESTLENVKFGEKAALEAYDKAKGNEHLCEKCLNIINDHYAKIKDALSKADALEEKFD